MAFASMAIKELRQLASEFELVSAYLVPFRHESRTTANGEAAIWYRIVFEVKVGGENQRVALATSRGPLRRFANPNKALEMLEDEFSDSEFEQIAILRKLENAYNEQLDTLELSQ
ncbi:hypothetical protein [Enterovibrio paralichthyis]|uniref:hypothetical protein n=1 Tax=Enterovibrio paralichthyis TaxID=2853805 RepID=UPI001C479151|nr:hypothetical protein [Enterovibrio paralichthyis]MBV7300264.1 hypothetical protein [Enterovibrio paralichthyis]